MVDWQDRLESQNGRQIVSPIFHMVIISFCIVILSVAFYIRSVNFRTLDEPIKINSLTPLILAGFKGVPEVINLGLHIDRFYNFDVPKNIFEMSGSLWFEYESGAISLKNLEKFYFERGMILNRSEPDIKLVGSRIFVRYMIRVSFHTNLSFRDFPFDDHRIDLVIGHPFLSPEEFVFDVRTSNFIQQDKLSTFGWHEVSRSAKSGFRKIFFSQDSLDRKLQYPIAIFSIKVENHGFRYILSTLLPIFFIYYLMFFAFSVDPGSATNIALAGITGILAYRFVIESLSPISSDLMLSDYYFFLVLASSMLLFLFSNIDVFIITLSVKIKKISIFFIHMFNLISSIYLLLI